MQINMGRIIRASRISLALAVGFIVAEVLQLPHPMWVPITIVVILFDQYTVGGAIQRSMLRIAATIISAIIGVLVIYAFNDSSSANNIVIIAGTFIYAYLYMDTKQSYIGVLGAITLAMVLSESEGLATPILRSIAIIIGVGIALITMAFFFPKYAKKHIITLFSNSLNTTEKIIKQFVNPKISLEQILKSFLVFEASFINDVVKINRMLDEAKFEVKSKEKIEHYPQAIIHLRRIYRLLGVILQNIPDNEVRFNSEITEQMNNLANMFNIVQQKLFSRKVNFNDIMLEHLILVIPKKSQTDNHELIFMHSLIKCLIQESNALVTSLSH